MWYFRSPLIAFGEDALSHLEQLTYQRVFIVTDAMMARLGFVQQVKNRMSAGGAQFEVFSAVEPDPCAGTVRQCAAQMEQFAPDVVIGLGGGSALDAAKAAWFLYERPEYDLAAVTPFEQYGLRAKARFILIPTTAGSGAEVTGAAIILDDQAGRKMEVATYEMIPDLTVVDPKFSSSMPPQLTADTGIDVLTHAIEGYTSTFANDFSDALCLHAVRLVFTYLPRAYHNGAADAEARQKMANAATISALGMGNSHIALAHALGHSLGAVFGLPHGRVTGIALPYSIEFTANAVGGRYADLARLLGLPAHDYTEAARSLARAVRELMRQIRQPVSLAQAGLSP
ncbi:MAG: iron-containing alcohol dehydrogenase, partial [Chloroflexota bacterium]